MLDDGSVSIFDPQSGEQAYFIPHGYMYDAAGAYSDAVTYSLYSGGERTENYMSYVSGNSRIVGALVSEIDTTGVTYRYFYDENTGELLASGNVDSGNGMAYTYDAVGRMTQAVPATVTLSSGSEYTYSSAEAFTYTYDASGNITEIKKNGATL